MAKSLVSMIVGSATSKSAWAPADVPDPRFPSINITNISQGWTTTTTLLGTGEGEGGGGESRSGSGWCSEWQSSQHTLFQLAHLCAALAFLSPATFRLHLPLLRALLALSSLLLSLWALLLVCRPDVLAWALLAFILNVLHLAWAAYGRLVSSLPPLQAGLYAKVFRSVQVKEEEFRELCQQGSQVEVSEGALLSIEGATPCAYLSVLVKGRLKVTYKRLFLHHVEIHQFVDASEYDFMSQHLDHSDTYQVSIAAAEDSVVLRWEYKALQEYLSTRPFISTVLHYLTGKDVCSQLYALQEQLMQAPGYMAALPSRHSSMVNVRSCLAAHDSSATLGRLADPPTDSNLPYEAADTIAISRPLFSHTEETSL